jgi:hypothetical protein
VKVRLLCMAVADARRIVNETVAVVRRRWLVVKAAAVEANAVICRKTFE